MKLVTGQRKMRKYKILTCARCGAETILDDSYNGCNICYYYDFIIDQKLVKEINADYLHEWLMKDYEKTSNNR